VYTTATRKLPYGKIGTIASATHRRRRPREERGRSLDLNRAASSFFFKEKRRRRKWRASRRSRGPACRPTLLSFVIIKI
jgi:hypothetical protein